MQKITLTILALIFSFIFGLKTINAQCGPDGTQPCPAANKTKTVNKTKSENTKAKTPSKSLVSLPPRTKMTVKASPKPENILFKNVSAETKLLPLNGITLGKTTKAEIAQIGQPCGGDYHCYLIENKWRVFYDKQNVASNIIVPFNGMPSELEKADFSFHLTYDQWTLLLTRLGYKIEIMDKPSDYGGNWRTRIKAVKTPDEPVFVLYFYVENGQRTGYSYTDVKDALADINILLDNSK